MLGYDPFRRFFSNLDPEIDVIRTENGFDVEIPVAGFKSEDVEITVKEDVLTITGKNDRRACPKTSTANPSMPSWKTGCSRYASRAIPKQSRARSKSKPAATSRAATRRRDK